MRALNLETIEGLASILDVSPTELISLANAINDHVRVIRRKKGNESGFREICIPSDKLKYHLRLINKRILQPIFLPENLQGGVPGKSTNTNAQHHLGKNVVLTLDIKNFYSQIHHTRIYQLFIELGCSTNVARLLTRLTTFNYHLAPGFPTSSTLANLVLAKITPRINGLCIKHDITFTSWQDNMYFSGDFRVPKFINLVSRIFREAGFKLHRANVMTQNEAQIVSGWMVNSKLNISKKEYRYLRSSLYKCIVMGIDSIADRPPEKYIAHLRGRISRVTEVNPKRGEKLLKDWDIIISQQ